MEMLDKPIHVQPLPHRTNPYRGRRGRAKGPPGRRARGSKTEQQTEGIKGQEGHYCIVDGELWMEGRRL